MQVDEVGTVDRARELRQREAADAAARRGEPHLEAARVAASSVRRPVLAQHEVGLDADRAQALEQHAQVGLDARQAARGEHMGDAQRCVARASGARKRSSSGRRDAVDPLDVAQRRAHARTAGSRRERRRR